MPVGLSDSFFVPCIPTKTVNLGIWNFSVGGGNYVISKREFPVALLPMSYKSGTQDTALRHNTYNVDTEQCQNTSVDIYNLCSCRAYSEDEHTTS